MRLTELLSGVSVLEWHCADLEITALAYDSRKVVPGSAFVVVAGYQTDGYRYINAAMQAGASVVLTDRVPETPSVPYVLIEQPRKALAICSENFFGHPAREMKLIGVTGTNGKTTVTYLLKRILEQHGAKVGLIGTNQNLIGAEVIPTERTTPESFELHALFRRMADAGCAYVLMEVSSHSLELDRVYGLQFAAGIYTNLTQDHLDFHQTMKAYAAAKAKLFSQSEIGVINFDDVWKDTMSANATCEIATYSAQNKMSDFFAENICLEASRVEFDVAHYGKITLSIPGAFSVYNALAVTAAALKLGIPFSTISTALKEEVGVCGRAEVVKTETPYTVMIDYAHTPDALENILKTVRGFAKGRVILVFGCGGDRDKTKRPQMANVASQYADYVVVTSDNPRTEEPMSIIEDILEGITLPNSQFAVEADRKTAIGLALEYAQAGDIVLLAGKGHETYQEINHVKYHMDERELIAELLG